VIRVTAPEGCILNAKHPAPVAGRHVTGQMLPDVMFGCLHQALGGHVPAEGTSCLWNLRLMGGLGRAELTPEQMKTATPYNVMSFHSGGTGARTAGRPARHRRRDRAQVGQAAAAQGAFLGPRQRPPDRLDAGRRRLR
jgi:N-methylhydantoinase B/oxoprolinase/acetone carboxylase alpha subunit